MTEQENHTPEETIEKLPEPEPQKKPNRKKWLKRTLLTLLFTLMFLVSFTAWLIGTHAGLRFAAFTIPSWFGVQIDAKTVNGTIWHGFDANDLTINTAGADIKVSDMVFIWQSSRLWDRIFWVDALNVGQVHIQTKDSKKEKSKTPPKLPKSISLPLEVYIGKVSLQGLTLNKGKEKIVWDSEITYTYKEDKHGLSIVSLNTPWVEMSGNSVLDGSAAPFALSGKINLTARQDAGVANGVLDLSGNLETIALEGNLTAEHMAISLQSRLKPFMLRTFQKIDYLRMAVGGLDPNAFDKRAPKGTLSLGVLLEGTTDQKLSGQLSIANLEPASWSQKGIPVQLLQGRLLLDRQGVLMIEELSALGLKDGTLDLTGTVDLMQKKLGLNLNVANFQAQDVVDSSFKGHLNGDVKAQGAWDTPDVSWTLGTEVLDSSGKLNFVRQQQGQQLSITDTFIKAKAGGGFQLGGTIDLFGKQAVKLKASTDALNPNTILTALPDGAVTSSLDVDGFLSAPMTLNGKLNIARSRLSQSTLQGTADLSLLKERLTKANINIALGQNTVKSQGSLGTAQDRLNVDINAPALKEAGLDLSGLLTVHGVISGEFKKLKLDLTGKASALQYKDILRIGQLDAKVNLSPDLQSPLTIKADGRDITLPGSAKTVTRQVAVSASPSTRVESGTEAQSEAVPKETANVSNVRTVTQVSSATKIQFIDLSMTGTGSRHQFILNTDAVVQGNPYKAQITSSGGLNQNYDWKGTIQKLDVRGTLDILLQNAVSLEIGKDHLNLGRANWSALGGSLSLQSLNWKAGQGFSSVGSGSNLQVGKLSRIVSVPYTESLTLKGDWNFQYGSSARGYIKVEHQAGDVLIPASKSGRKALPLDLRKLMLNAQFQGNGINVSIDGVTQHATVTGNVSINQHGSNFSASSLGGKLNFKVPDVTTLRLLVPVGMNIGGSFNADIGLSGTVGNPGLTGTLNGDNLLYRERNLGLRLAEGTLRSHFAGQNLVIDSLSFKSAARNDRPQGVVTGKGVIENVFRAQMPNVKLDVNFDRFNIFEARPNRILVISGNGQVEGKENAGISVNADLKVNFARIDLPKVGTPALDDDVVIVNQPKKEVVPLPPVHANISIDLGDRFMFQGIGLDVTLGGKLNMTSQPGVPLKAMGRVSVLKGGYRAYGQDLVIEKGNIIFVGSLNNPVLNIRAKRRYSPVGAGVEVTGPVSAMHVNLIADEAMSQKDKLAWLVLGRAAAGDQDDDMLAASAGAWIAGSVNDKVRFFDDLGISTRAKRTLKTGEVSPAEQIAVVGKHLSENLYVGYEYGLDSAESAVRLSYQLTRALQFLFRIGTEASSVETKYSIRFD